MSASERARAGDGTGLSEKKKLSLHHGPGPLSTGGNSGSTAVTTVQCPMVEAVEEILSFQDGAPAMHACIVQYNIT